ncbi:P-loop NTPase fold protein [Pseudomonas sp. JZ134]|uniref:P-loop NTPase fold protein n=1 Tax=Pseudomonas sp. JZ134 TaxID=2806615 RepID=UPI003DA1AC9C
MSKSFELTKEALIQALADNNIKVIALSGDWGTGKTYLWKEAEKGFNLKNKDKVGSSSQKPPIYATLFGAKSVNELKLKLVNSATGSSEISALLTDGAKSLAAKLLPGLPVESAILLSAPKMLSNRLIVIDDIERKHKDLDIEEVLGFINEFSELHNVKFLILVNSNKLIDKELWDKFHEKVIDHEIKLNPSIEDAFTIANSLVPVIHPQVFSEYLSIIHIKNIRVIKKILNLFNRIHKNSDLQDEEVARPIIATTLLVAGSHYTASPHIPTAAYLESYDSLVWAMKSKESNDEKSVWNRLLQELDTHIDKSYADGLNKYIETGFIENTDIDLSVRTIAQFQKNRKANELYDEFKWAYLWDKSLNEESLKPYFTRFFGSVKSLNAVTVTLIAEAFDEFGLKDYSLRLINEWVDKNKNTLLLSRSEAARTIKEVHPLIAEMINEESSKLYPPLSFEAAVASIAKDDNWLEQELKALDESTIETCIEVLQRLNGSELALFLSHMFHIARISNRGPETQKALDNFLAAVHTIIKKEPNSREAKILQRAFTQYGADGALKALDEKEKADEDSRKAP